MMPENDSRPTKSNGSRLNGNRRYAVHHEDLYALEEDDLLAFSDEMDDDFIELEDEGDWLDDEMELSYQPIRRQRPLSLPQLITQAIKQTSPAIGSTEPPIWYDHPALNPVPAAASIGLKATYRQMQQLALTASAANHPAEAVALIGATLPLALQQAPQVQQRLVAILPVWAQAITQIVLCLHKQTASRPYIATLPAILWQATAVLSRHASQKPLTTDLARQVLATQALNLLKQLPLQSDEAWEDEDNHS